MLGGLLGALMSGVGLAVNAGQQQTANAVNWRAVMEQIRANQAQEALAKEMFGEQKQLAEADRGDAYGNKITYDPYKGFEYDLTALTSAILNGQQHEQLTGLREDAPRQRAAAERMDDRSKMADTEFEKEFNNFRFRPQRNEGEYISDATTQALNARERGLSEAANEMAKQLLRTGNTSNVAKVYKESGDQYAKGLTDALLQAKQIGRQNFQADSSFDTQQGQSDLGFLKGIADQTATGPVDAGTYNSDLTGRGDAAMQQLIQVLQSGGKNVTDLMSKDAAALTAALQNAAQGFGQQLDFSGIASALSKLSFGEKGSPASGGQDLNKQFENPFALQGVNAFGQAQNADPWAGLRGAI